MKDPLQKNPTPYEILEVDETADRKEIKLAFSTVITSRKKTSEEANEAQKTLIRSVEERTLVDIFLYNEAFLSKLRPRLGDDDAQLLKGRRKISQDWEVIQKTLFPHFASTHSLAVLWYWWALHREEEKLSKLNNASPDTSILIPQTPDFSILWTNTISNWVFLMNSEDFWEEWAESKEMTGVVLTKEDVKRVCEKMGKHFTNIFHSYEEKYRKIGDSNTAKVYKEYKLAFSTEMYTATQMYTATRLLEEEGLQLNIGGKAFTVCCGQKMLEKLGYLEGIRVQLQNIRGRIPAKSRDLNELIESLSPHFDIEVLVRNEKFDEAIDKIKSLSSSEKKTREVQLLLAKACLGKGDQCFSVKQYEEALEWYKKGLGTGELKEKISDTAVSQVKSEAATLQKEDPNTAIRILEKAIKIVPDISLKQNLSLICLQRGIDRINKAQKTLDKDSRALLKAKAEVKKGVKELERSVELDPANLQAKEQLETAKKVLDNFELNAVYKDMEAKHWEEAFSKLEKILSNDAGNERAKELIGICCVQWAQEQIDKTKDLDLARATLEKGLKYDPYSVQINKNLMAIKRIYEAQLNAEGVALANRAGEELTAGNISTASELIEKAEATLKRALAKKPGDSQIKKNLEQVRLYKAIINLKEGRPDFDHSGSLGYTPTPTYDFSAPKRISSLVANFLSWAANNIIWVIWIIIMILILIFH